MEPSLNAKARPRLLFSDGEIAVAVKPSGIDSQDTPNAANMVAELSSTLGGEIYSVHRLDRETSGVMVYARTREAAASLSYAFSHEQTKKRYLAVLLGTPSEHAGEYRDLLYHDAKRNKSYVVSCARRGVREAILKYSVVSESHGLTLAAIRLMTGRTHQIRVQFASRGTPVLGDRRYGGKPDAARWGIDIPAVRRGIALCCVSLSFPHPKTGCDVSFTSLPSGSPWDAFDLDGATRVIAEIV